MYEGPYEPTYDGPGDWELASAREKLKMWQLHMTARIERFKKREQHDHMQYGLAIDLAYDRCEVDQAGRGTRNVL